MEKLYGTTEGLAVERDRFYKCADFLDVADAEKSGKSRTEGIFD